MQQEERRKSARVPARLAVGIRVGARYEPCEAIEIALGGVFVATSNVRPVHQLLDLRVDMPEGEPLHVHGMVARRVDSAESWKTGYPAGMGIRFYGLRPEAQKSWDGYVRGEMDKLEAELRRRAEALAQQSDMDPSIVAAALSADEEATRSASRGRPGVAAAPATDRSDSEPPAASEEVRNHFAPEIITAALLPDEEEPSTVERAEPRPAVEEDDAPEPAPIFVIGEVEEKAAPSEAASEEPPFPDDEIEPVDLPSERVTVAMFGKGRAGAEAKLAPDTIPMPAGSVPDLDDDVEDDDEPDTLVRDSDPFAAEPRLPVAEQLGTERPPTDVTVGGSVSQDVELQALLDALKRGLAPAEAEAHVVYRIELASVEALLSFADTALTAGGVVVRTDDERAPGTPAVICVAHPHVRDEFHLPGEVAGSGGGKGKVPVAFTGLTERTVEHFRSFALLTTGDDEDTPFDGLAFAPDELALHSIRSGELDEVPRDTSRFSSADVRPLSSEPDASGE